ncbi:GIY-YIG nuclease family protein [Candidatus Gracilibacteria bacterium]|nr:GIY-YIG nuclease family protein [Candidatus Gracilibacteria bacterium]MCF7898480.1 GIY-YIG nuclease family protein [Candidatus Paceibacterota bacterium]
MHYVYVIKRDGKPYIGYTKDLKRRFTEHSCNYKCEMVYYEAYCSSDTARERELQLKQYGNSWASLKKRLLI